MSYQPLNQITQEDVIEAHGNLRKRGNEWVGPCPCPSCGGGDDRFYVRPSGRFFCRKCLPDGKNVEKFKEILMALSLGHSNPAIMRERDYILVSDGAIDYREWRKMQDERLESEIEARLVLEDDEKRAEMLEKVGVESFRSMQENPPDPISWLVSDLLVEDGISLLVGDPKAGKSTLARSLAATISAGNGDFLGKMAAKAPVVYLALEESRGTVFRQFEGMSPDPDGLHIVVGQPKTLDWNTLGLIIKALEAKLLVVDTVFRMLQIEDGNSYAETTEAFRPLIEIARETKCHVLCVHHTNKISGTSRGHEILGSQGIGGSVDAVLSLRISTSKETEGMRVISAFGRDDVDMNPTVLHRGTDGRIAPLGGVDSIEDPQEVQDTPEQIILARLRVMRYPMTKEELAKLTKIRKQDFLRALRNLRESEEIVASGTGVKGDPLMYALPPENAENEELGL